MRGAIVPSTVLVTINLLLLLLATGASADNWMRSEDEFYFKAGLGYDSARQRWDNNREVVDISCTSNNWTHNQTYEYGLSYYYTVFGSLQLMDRRCGEKAARGFGDITLGVRGRLNVYRNGRTWEASMVVPTNHRSTGEAPIGSGLYGLRLGAFGSFGNRRAAVDEMGSDFELGANIHIWQGSAPEQLTGYVKVKYAPGKDNLLYTALEGDYALVGRNKEYVATDNQQDIYGYDRLNLRLGYTRKASLYWRVSVEATSVLWGRNASKTNGININFSRSFLD